jgi:hypothetical protein
MQGFFKTTKRKLSRMPLGIPESKSYENPESDLSSYCDDSDWIHNFNSDIDFNLDEIPDCNDKINYEDFIDFEDTGKSVETSDKGLLASISAFSTITTMLSRIKHGMRCETNLDLISGIYSLMEICTKMCLCHDAEMGLHVKMDKGTHCGLPATSYLLSIQVHLGLNLKKLSH